MITSNEFDFGLPTIANSNTATCSPYVFDAGSDKIIFGGMQPVPLWLWFRAVVTADASPTLRVSMVGSDNADMDINDNETLRNIVLADTGTLTDHPTTGVAIVTGDIIELAIPIRAQTAARQYYGLIVTLGGTNPDLAAGQPARVVRNPQTNMYGARAAIPA